MSAPAGNGEGGQVDGGVASLDVLAAQLRDRGWNAYINTAPGWLPRLFVQDPDKRAECGAVIAVPSGPAGDLWYWFSWAERIAPVRAPGAAADAIIRTFQRPRDTPVSVTSTVSGLAVLRVSAWARVAAARSRDRWQGAGRGFCPTWLCSGL